MRKIYVLGFALFALVAFSGIAGSSAMAEKATGSTPAFWLVEGTALPDGEANGEATDIEDELTLFHLGLMTLKCSGLIEGTIYNEAAGGFGLVNMVWDLLSPQKLIELGLASVLCTSSAGCENTGDVEFTPENLPWLITLVLMTLDDTGASAELFLILLSDDGKGQPAYFLDCLIFSFLIEEECLGETSADLELMIDGSLLAVFISEEQELEELEGSCKGTANVNTIEGSAAIVMTGPNAGLELEPSSTAEKVTDSTPAFWLVEGVALPDGEANGETTDIQDELTLIHLGLATLKCSGLIEGTIYNEAAGGFGLVSMIWDLLTPQKLIELGLASILCTSSAGCENTGDVQLTPENLPWLITLVFMTLDDTGTTAELFLVLLSDDGKGQPAYSLDCLFFGFLVEEECSGETSADLELMIDGSLLAVFISEEQELEELEGSCKGTANVATLEGSGAIVMTGPNAGLELEPSSTAEKVTDSTPAFWLVEGVALPDGEANGEATDVEDELTLINLGLETLKCSGLIEGTIYNEAAGGFGLVSMIWDLLTPQKLIELGLASILCTSSAGCENTGDVEFTPENLPWLVTLVLMTLDDTGTSTELFLVLLSDDGKGQPAYFYDCLFFGFLVEEECSGETSADLELMIDGSLLAILISEEQELEELEGSCKGTANVATFEGSGAIIMTGPNAGRELEPSSTR